MSEKLSLNFIKDVPVNHSSGDYFRFYHEYVSPTLETIVGKEVHTIGLFGKWGSGKSTIIKILKDNSEYPVYVFDTWKYQNDPLRRTFLLNIFSFIQENKLWAKGKELTEEFLYDMYESTSKQTEELIEDSDSGRKNIFIRIACKVSEVLRKNPLLGGCILVGLSWLILQLKLGEGHPFINPILSIVGIISQSAGFTFILVTFAKVTLESLSKKFIDDINKEGKTSTIIKTKDFLNSPEQFENKFKEILTKLKSKIVIVFDNIDRVQGKEAIEVLSSIKTFLEPENCTNALFVIPCDYEALSKQVREIYKEDAAEFLRKLFTVSLWTPEFIGVDLEDYTHSLIKSTGKDHTLLDSDVAYVIRQAYGDNPRQIKQFINNLIAELYLASNSDVWEIIKGNVAYLAKVLVIRQEYPSSYNLLKSRWSNPENIIPETKEVNTKLTAFLENTRPISTKNATPFIYFKAPVRAQNIKNYEEIELAILSKDYAKAGELISENKDFENVVQFVLALFNQYANLPEEEYKLVVGSIVIFCKLKNSCTNSDYYNEVARKIDKDLWNNYATFPTEEIFSFILENKLLKKALSSPVIERYISVIDSEELKKQESRQILIQILQSLRAHKNLLTKKNKEEVAQKIQSLYSTQPDILDIYREESDIDDFFSDQTIDNIVTGINPDTYKSLLPHIPKIEKRIITLELSNAVFDRINELVRFETSQSPDHRDEKDILYSSINTLLSSAKEIKDYVNGNYADGLANEVITATKNITQQDNRRHLISCLQHLSFVVNADPLAAITELRSQFLSQAAIHSVKAFLEYEKSLGLAEEIINEDMGSIYTNIRSNVEYREVFYTFADEAGKKNILADLMRHTPNLGLDFLSTINSVPDREELVSIMLDSLSNLKTQYRSEGYKWVLNHLRDNDRIEIKEKLTSQITTLLKSDDNTESQIGYDLYIKADKLSQSTRRDIAQNTLEWLRDPSNNTTEKHKWAIQGVIYAIKELGLSETPMRDLVHLLLRNVRNDTNILTLEVVLDSLAQLHPTYYSNSQDFDDMVESLKISSTDEVKNLVSTNLSPIRPKKLRGKAKKFWDNFDAATMINKNPETVTTN